MNTNHSISAGKLWQLFIVGKDVFVIVLTTYWIISLYLSFFCSNNVNTNHSISGGKLWQLFIVGKDVFVIVLTTYMYDGVI